MIVVIPDRMIVAAQMYTYKTEFDPAHLTKSLT